MRHDLFWGRLFGGSEGTHDSVPAFKACLHAEAAGVPRSGGAATAPLLTCPLSRERSPAKGHELPRRGQVSVPVPVPVFGGSEGTHDPVPAFGGSEGTHGPVPAFGGSEGTHGPVPAFGGSEGTHAPVLDCSAKGTSAVKRRALCGAISHYLKKVCYE